MRGVRTCLWASLACVPTAMASPHDHGPPCANDPRCFRASESVLSAVEDARWVVTIRDAGSMMGTRAGSAAKSLVATLAGAGPRARTAAALLGRSAGTPAEGFAVLARHEIRIAVRGDGRWVAFARLDEDEQRRILASLKPTVEGDGSLLDGPTGLALRSRPEWLLIASDPETLPQELPAGWASPPPGDPDAPEAVVARIEMLARRECGSELVRAVGECEGDRLSMRFRFRACDRDPIPGPVPGFDGSPIAIDPAAIDRLGEGTILCEIASRRADLPAEDGLVLASLPEMRLPATFRQNLGRRRIVIVGEVDGRNLPGGPAMRCPAVAVASEVEDPEQARGDQDSLMRSAISGLRRILDADPESTGLMPEPTRADLETRSVPLGMPIERLAGAKPWFAAMELSWGVVDGPESDWQVYATHPAWLGRVGGSLRTLATCPEEPAEESELAVSMGRFDGERLARHLESWSAGRDRFPTMSDRLWEELAECARIARHVPRLDWKASRRGPAILVEIDARLVEP